MRDKSIDALKGLAIALVVLGHAIPHASGVSHPGPGLLQIDETTWVPVATATNLVFNLLYSFHMPLFALVSGYVMWPPRGGSIGEQVLRRARALLVPYLAWIAISRIQDLMSSDGSTTDALRALPNALIGQGGLWYLYVLFVSAVAVSLITRLPRPRLMLAGSALVLIGGAVVYLTFVSDHLPGLFYAASIVWIYPFVVMGYLVATWKEAVLRHRGLVVAVGLAAFGALFYLRYPIYAPDMQPLAAVTRGSEPAWTFVFTKSLAYLCATAALLVLFAVYSGRRGRGIEVQAWIGRRSLGVYAMHGAVLGGFIRAGIRDPWLLFALSLGIPLIVTLGIERIPVLDSVLLGRTGSRVPRGNDGEVQLAHEPAPLTESV